MKPTRPETGSPMDDDLLLLDDDAAPDAAVAPAQGLRPWVVLVVDDDSEVHAMTRLLLGGFRFQGRGIELLTASSGAEGEALLRKRSDIAMALLDVVMETDDAGLKLVKLVRDELGNRLMTLVLRTGQPGSAPEEDVVLRYDINDYREKTELTLQKLLTMVIAGLRHHQALADIERGRAGLEQLLAASSTLFDRRPPAQFATEAARQVQQLLGGGAEVYFYRGEGTHTQLIAARRETGSWTGTPDADVARAAATGAADGKVAVVDLNCRVHLPVRMVLRTAVPLAEAARRLIAVCCATLAVGFDNAQLYADVFALNLDLETQVAERTSELTDKSRLLETTLGSMSDGLAVFDSEGYLRVWNERALELLGAPADVAYAGWHYKDLDAVLTAAGATIDVGTGGGSGKWEDISFPDGRAVQVRRTAMADGGHVHIFLDVTDERRRERELIAARAEAEAAVKARTEFMAVMSHEIRTPMNGIMGMTQLALGLARDPQMEDHLQTIRYSGEALLAILNDILDFSKLEAGGLRFDAHPFDLRRTVDGVLSLMSSRAAEKGLLLSARVAPDVPRFLVGDAGRLRQVLLNLVGNGLKFTPQGSVRISVAAEPTTGERVRLRFTVVDTGIGIAPEAQGRLFQSYSQADETISRRFGGTGLGLAICRRIVDLQGGRIGFESTLGSGSRFWFELDFDVGNDEQMEAARADREPPTRSLNILLAEDTAVNQRVGVGLLERAGHKVTLVDNGQRALDAVIVDDPYDVVLMDIHMPEMDGIEATRAIRALEGSKGRVPIVALTAAVTTADMAAAVSAGMNGFISKPLDPGRLYMALARAVHHLGDIMPKMPTSAGVVLDPAYIRELGEVVGRESASELVANFFDSAGKLFRELSCLLDEDPVRASFLAHTFSGSASSLGFLELATFGSDIEAACRDGRADEVKEDVGRLPALLSAARQQLIEQSPGVTIPKAPR